MAGLVPAIHVLNGNQQEKTWMPGTSPGMTSSLYRVRPPGKRIEDFVHYLAVVAARARQYVEGVIGAFHQMQRLQRSQTFHHAFDQRHLGQRVTAALQEQHRKLDRGEMIGAVDRGLARRVQWKADKREPANAWQRRCRLRLRGHAAAERLSARDQGDAGKNLCGLCDRRAHRGLRDRW